MKLGKTLFARLGLYARHIEAPDVFDLRLERMGLRERRSTAARIAVFRTLSSRLAA